MRSAKLVTRHFPHSVRDIELVLAMLAQPYVQQSPVSHFLYLIRYQTKNFDWSKLKPFPDDKINDKKNEICSGNG